MEIKNLIVWMKTVKKSTDASQTYSQSQYRNFNVLARSVRDVFSINVPVTFSYTD